MRAPIVFTLLFMTAACAVDPNEPSEADQDFGSAEQDLKIPDDDDDQPEHTGPINPPPSNLAVHKNYGGRSLSLRFTCAKNADGHWLQRRAPGGTWNTLKNACIIAPNQNTVVADTTIAPATDYCYRILASNADHSAHSSELCVTTDRYREAPELPTVEGSASKDEIVVEIIDNSLIEQGYRVYKRRHGTSDWGDVWRGTGKMEGTGGRLRVHDTSASADDHFDYKVVVYHQWDSASTIVSVKMPPSVPVAPSNVRFSEVESTSVVVAWDDNSFNEDGFRIEYESETKGSGDRDVDADTESKKIYLGSNATYRVRVVAFNESGEAASAWASVTTAPQAPTQADLAPFEVSTNPAFPNPGQAFTFSWRDCNFGQTAASNYRTVVRLDGSSIHNATYNLAAETCTWRSINVQGLSAGSHYIDVTENVDGTVPEANLNNNYNINSFNVN